MHLSARLKLISAVLEMELVQRQANEALKAANVQLNIPPDVTRLLVTTFSELRSGVTHEGERVERPSTPMSTAEAVSIAISSGMHAWYYDKGKLAPNHMVRHLVGAVIKDDPDDLQRLQGYFNRVVRKRASKGGLWRKWYEARKWLQ